MKVAIIMLLFPITLLAQSQDSNVKINKWEYMDVLETNPKIEHVFLLENGKPYTKNYLDSIQKTKNHYKFKQEFLLDSVQKKITVVLKEMSNKEMRESDNEFLEIQKKDKSNRKKLMGSTLKDLSFTDMDGNHYTSESLKGKMVFLNFWFTKCAPCIKEMPDLNKLKEKYGTENVAYFAITYNKKEMVERFLTKQQLDFTVIPNEKSTIDAVGVSFYPTNILLDQNGKVLFLNELFAPKSNNGIDEIENLIKKHTKKP